MIRAWLTARRPPRAVDVRLDVMRALLDHGPTTVLHLSEVTGHTRHRTGRAVRDLTRWHLATGQARPGDRTGVRLYSARAGLITSMIRAGQPGQPGPALTGSPTHPTCIEVTGYPDIERGARAWICGADCPRARNDRQTRSTAGSTIGKPDAD